MSAPPPTRPPYFFTHPTFEAIFLSALGRSYQQGGDVGKVLYLSTQVADGDFDSAYAAFRQAGDEARERALTAVGRGHGESARQAFLWAQNYYDSATAFCDESSDAGRFLPTWELQHDCWMRSLPYFRPAIETVQIPYDTTTLKGFYCRGHDPGTKRRLLIMTNGSDGGLQDMWNDGAAGALARGYDVLIYDGPGQGHALWKQQLYFRHDWEKVLTPVVDFALTLPGVDERRIALQGISQGGYWVTRAVAFEKRIAATIADPGCVNVAEAWTRPLPEALLEMLRTGQKEAFDGVMGGSLAAAQKKALNFRMRPFGMTSYFDVYTEVMRYDLTDVAGTITCPMLITDPDAENFWPGQPRRLYDLLRCPKTLMRFSAADGGDGHCEPTALGLRECRMFDWLDEILA